ncbi:MAG TPA: hypothetical protein VFI95_20610 [Terriglobales bacterium]|nr:hypothetical protein [Terriglobales bacterium]
MRNLASRRNLLTAIAGVVLAFSGIAYAAGAADPVATKAYQKAPKAKGGTLTISAATDVGSVTLEPGKYEVKQVNSPAGPVIRFTLVTPNPYAEYAEESLPLSWWEVVARVKVTMQPLTSKATRTALRFEPDGSQAVALQIRGNSFDYQF